VAHFTNPIDSVRKEDLAALLDGRIADFRRAAGSARALRLVVDERIAGALLKAYPRLRAEVARLDCDESLAADRSILGLCDVRALRPHFKLIAVDGAFPWGRRVDDYTIDREAAYPLLLSGAMQWKPKSSFTVVQTGVTAMTRAFIAGVYRSGDVLYPVRETAPITAQADIALTSNEVSFLDPCTYPLKDRTRFCSPSRFFKILAHSGFDIIELTGNHNNDFGRRPNAHTLQLLRENGIAYYGGGKNRAEAERVLYHATGDVRIAFVGFNEVGPPEAWATDNEAGAARLSKALRGKAPRGGGRRAGRIRHGAVRERERARALALPGAPVPSGDRPGGHHNRFLVGPPRDGPRVLQGASYNLRTWELSLRPDADAASSQGHDGPAPFLRGAPRPDRAHSLHHPRLLPPELAPRRAGARTF